MRHVVAVEEPHVTSMAARVMLERGLRGAELDGWLAFRKAFLDAREARDGTLRCEYCGKEGLVRGEERGLAVMATVDHVVPRSKGGAERDEGNLAVACWSCNQRKADSEAEGRD